MATASETQSGEFMDRLGRLEDQMHRMQYDLNARLDAVEESRADDEAATLAAERIRSGAAKRARDGSEILTKLGIHTH